MSGARRLLVHVGLQKTGTSYLQAALLRSRAALAAEGLDLVPPTKRECFELMVVVRDRYEARRDPASDDRIVERFTRQLERAPGPRAVYSQESLAAATPPQIQRLLSVCGDREVHVVATVRDLARQLPSFWQEQVKAGGTTPFERYLRRLTRLETERRGRQPWIHLDPPTVLARWSEALAPDRIHVVTVPPRDAPRTLLLERFASVLGVDPSRLEPEESWSNASLGLAQAEVLRRVNLELPPDVHRRYVYSDVIKRSFGARVLGSQERRPITVPPGLRVWCDEVTARQVSELESARYHVVGTLKDLACPDSAFGDSARPREREVGASAVSALATLLSERGQAVAARRSGRIRAGGGWRSRVRRVVPGRQAT